MIIINGDFLCRNLTGIERFAFEICKHLDSLIEKDIIRYIIREKKRGVRCVGCPDSGKCSAGCSGCHADK